MNYSFLVSAIIVPIIGSLIYDCLFGDDKEEKKQDERSDE